MMRYVMVPGYGGSPAGHWQLAWCAELGEHAVMMRPRSWDEPDLADWVAAIDRAVAQSVTDGGSRLMLVAHSLGCWAVSAWCATLGASREPLVMMVAPPDPASAAFPREDAASFVSLRATPLQRRGVVVFSEDDRYCTPSRARTFADGWALDALSAGEHGHLNAESDVGSWDAGRRIRDGLADLSLN